MRQMYVCNVESDQEEAYVAPSLWDTQRTALSLMDEAEARPTVRNTGDGVPGGQDGDDPYQPEPVYIAPTLNFVNPLRR